jgi:hypothetical protein
MGGSVTISPLIRNLFLSICPGNFNGV